MNRTQNQPDSPAPAVDISPAEILRGAARYLELHGWTQGDYYAHTEATAFPPACVVGAIGMAAHGTATNCPHFDGPNPRDCNAAFAYLRAYLLDHGHIVNLGDDWSTEATTTGDWNDRDDQSAATVITVLRAAADDYDWAHATEDDLETYADACVWAEKNPTREGFLAWRAAQ